MAEINFDEALKKIADNPEIMSKISQIANDAQGKDIGSVLPMLIDALSPQIAEGEAEKADENSEKTDTPLSKTEKEVSNDTSQAALPFSKISQSISRNSKLLVALKPYLSKERCDILDSVLKMSQVADLMKLVK